MALLALCALVLLAVGGLGSPYATNTSPKDDNKYLAELHKALIPLFFHSYDSIKHVPEDWTLESHVDKFNNVTAVKKYSHMLENEWILPRNVPFSVLNESHKHEVIVLFNLLFSAKSFEALYDAALYLRNKVNESLFVYVFSVVLLHHPSTQGFSIPPIYEILPTYFNNAEIVETAERLISHSSPHIYHHPMCYIWNENIVIEWKDTIWPYYSHNTPVWYFTHDYALNAFYYFNQIVHPTWLAHDVAPIEKEKRGEWTWFFHKQLVARYYMELLSNGLGEIPELNYHIVEEGFNSGLVYPHGIPFPVRDDYYHLDQPKWAEAIEKIKAYETRIFDVLDKGFYVDVNGQNVPISSPESMDIIWNLIEANVDSPNVDYYKDFISIWKKVLGNSIFHKQYHNGVVPLEVPSVLEVSQTALRDPAFYMIWKRVLDIFSTWQKKLPPYTKEELGCQSVVINKVQVDKLLTYFELGHMNVTSLWYQDEEPTKNLRDDISVLVEYPRLNHKPFKLKVNVSSELAKKVVVKFFLAPKHDSYGHEIPLSDNSENFMLLDQFVHDVPQGDSVIVRESTANPYLTDDWESAHAIYNMAVKNASDFKIEHPVMKFPKRLWLPKGRANGMPFVLLVHISDYHPPKKVSPHSEHSFSYETLQISDAPIGFPVDRPLYPWVIKRLSNIVLQDVLIYHKHTPEIHVPHLE